VTGTEDPSDIKAVNAVYDQTAGNVRLNGSAEITRGSSYVRGDSITAVLTPTKKVKSSSVTSSGYLKSSKAERTTEIWADQLNAEFDEAQQVQKADASGAAKAVVTPVNQVEYTTLALSTPGTLNASFRSGGLPANMKADGRSTIQLNAPNTNADSA